MDKKCSICGTSVDHYPYTFLWDRKKHIGFHEDCLILKYDFPCS